MGDSLRVESFSLGPLENNTYLVWDPESKEAVLVDPTMDSERLAARIRELGLSLKAILNTHGHFDHLAGNAFFASEFGCPVLIHENERPILREMPFYASLFGFTVTPSPEPGGLLKHGDLIPVGGASLRVLHTPGHSPGGACFAADGFVLSGDTLFAQSVGRTDLPGGSYETLLESIRRELFQLPDKTEVLPGHGPPTLIGFEKRHNPFVGGPP
jgi:glyoxylase-like metal-dependent hydrolase (beta-lactamase superfamily II)